MQWAHHTGVAERIAVIPPVRIASIIDGDASAALSESGGLGAPVDHFDVWFAEGAPRPAGCAQPGSDVVLRMRGGTTDDVTIQLQPSADTVFDDRWRQPFADGPFSFAVTSDWHGSRRDISAVALSRRPGGEVSAAVRDGTDPARLLDHHQRQFIVSCTPPGGAVMHRLTTLGPVRSTLWRIPAPRGGFGVTIERSQADDLDLLEVSTMLRPHSGEPAERFCQRAARRRQQLFDALGYFRMSASADDSSATELILAALRQSP